jgi:hypothetical protein
MCGMCAGIQAECTQACVPIVTVGDAQDRSQFGMPYGRIPSCAPSTQTRGAHPCHALGGGGRHVSNDSLQQMLTVAHEDQRSNSHASAVSHALIGDHMIPDGCSIRTEAVDASMRHRVRFSTRCHLTEGRRSSLSTLSYNHCARETVVCCPGYQSSEVLSDPPSAVC